MIPGDGACPLFIQFNQRETGNCARFAESARMGEGHGAADLRESHHRAKHRVHRRVSDVHHGTIAAGE